MRDAPRRGVVAIALAGILLLAAVVCALHVVNALTLRGTARVSDYEPLARAEQDMAVDEALFGAAQLSAVEPDNYPALPLQAQAIGSEVDTDG